MLRTSRETNGTSDTIGQRLTQLRKNSGRTQEALAFDLQELKVAIGPSDISKIEHDAKLPSTEALCRLCKIFGVSADYVLFGSKTMALPPDMSAKLENTILALAAEIQACRDGKS